MPLDVVSKGNHGRVYVTDTRDDGAKILLVCEPVDNPLDDLRGILLLKDAPVAAPPKPNPHPGSFPMDVLRPDFRGEEDVFSLTLDMSALEARSYQLRLPVFAAQAFASAAAGTTEVRLDADNIHLWGAVALADASA